MIYRNMRQKLTNSVKQQFQIDLNIGDLADLVLIVWKMEQGNFFILDNI